MRTRVQPLWIVAHATALLHATVPTTLGREVMQRWKPVILTDLPVTDDTGGTLLVADPSAFRRFTRAAICFQNVDGICVLQIADVLSIFCLVASAESGEQHRLCSVLWAPAVDREASLLAFREWHAARFPRVRLALQQGAL